MSIWIPNIILKTMDTHDIGIQNSNQIPHICGLNPNVAALQAPDIAA